MGDTPQTVMTTRAPAVLKMTQNDTRPGPGQNYGETDVFTFGLKMGFTPKNYPK